MAGALARSKYVSRTSEYGRAGGAGSRGRKRSHVTSPDALADTETPVLLLNIRRLLFRWFGLKWQTELAAHIVGRAQRRLTWLCQVDVATCAARDTHGVVV